MSKSICTFHEKYLSLSLKTETMKILFLTYHGFDPASGITKKMQAQIKGLRQNGHEVHVCSYSYAPNGHLCRVIDDAVLKDYGRGLRAAISQRMGYGCIYDFCVAEKIELVYARSYMNATPPLVSFFRKLRKAGIRCVMEIPTYPYDFEFKAYDWNQRMRLRVDQMFRRQLAAQMNGIVTFSDEETIFGQRTIRISNGVDLDMIPLHRVVADTTKEVHVIAVAEVHSWHGFDRFIHGLGRYYEKTVSRHVFLHIVGEVWPAEMEGSSAAPGFAPYIRQYGIADYVIFHGKLFGEALDEVFDKCSFAVGSLARHRSGITVIKTLKNREYASRGIPFVYSEQDSDFDHQPYVMKVPADESPVDVEAVLQFVDHCHIPPQDIRRTVEHLSWKNQMQQVIDNV